MDKWILSFTQSLIQFFKAEMAGMHFCSGGLGVFHVLLQNLTFPTEIPKFIKDFDKRKEIFNELP